MKHWVALSLEETFSVPEIFNGGIQDPLSIELTLNSPRNAYKI